MFKNIKTVEGEYLSLESPFAIDISMQHCF